MTALITGASQGVGREIALILAEKKWNLVLTARNAQKLQVLESEIREKFGVEVFCFQADLSAPAAAKSIFDFCEEKRLQIDLLANNAGCGIFGESVEIDATPMLNLNVVALTEMCAIFGKKMKERKSGSILNIGSLAGNQATPFFASYAASKNYVLMYSIALRHELARFGVNVTCVQPGYIRTDFDNNCGIKSAKYKKFSYNNGMTARAVANVAVKSALAKRSYVRAGIGNKIAGFFSGLLPKDILAGILGETIGKLTADE